MKHKFLVVSIGSDGPDLYGPFKTDHQRDGIARVARNENTDNEQKYLFYALDIEAEGPIMVDVNKIVLRGGAFDA